MSTYGRNFEFRVQPTGGERSGRYINGDTIDIPLGAPVRVDTTSGENTDKRLPVKLAAGNTPAPRTGMAGILIHEWAPNAFSGSDPLLTVFSDRDYTPKPGSQENSTGYLVSGPSVSVMFRNTDANNFFFQRTYAARKMVAGVAGATPTVVVGDLLRPHDTPNDTNGYWQETSTASEAWLVVTHVDNTRQEVEARFLF